MVMELLVSSRFEISVFSHRLLWIQVMLLFSRCGLGNAEFVVRIVGRGAFWR